MTSLIKRTKTLWLSDSSISLGELRDKLRLIFKRHIGEENAISSSDLFTQCFDMLPEKVDIYRRIYLWQAVKVVLRDLRSGNTLFVIAKVNKLFVLQSEQELKFIKMKVRNHITALHHMETNAVKWVKDSLWKEALSYKEHLKITEKKEVSDG